MTDKRILAIDSKDYILASYRFLLADSGFSVVTTKETTEAMRLLEAERFDLLLYELPHGPVGGDLLFDKKAMDNLKIIHKQHPNLSIIVLSTEPQISHGIKELGIIKGLEKPFEREELIGAIREILSTS